ncbi:RICIN domain-containing protein [Saccharothrix deserti]|uniref:RICIN domain-containing protein n=1 Tax=Saccharothrix deserti TaxID=2593674 RepID=UPI00131B85D0|nr:RICIN domain-containing protein [Saccharothrix deserti]
MARVLNVVAHHDDDLLFLSPDLLTDLRDGAVVRTVFLVASDYHTYPTYMQERELGVREVYAFAAGMTGTPWRSHAYSCGNLSATLWTLGARVSILENRLPDNATAPPNRLWLLYARNQTSTGRPLDHAPAQTTDRAKLVDYLRAVIADFAPDVVRTTDPTADLHGQHTSGRPLEDFYFHRDHVATARLVRTALPDVPSTPEVVYYRDYTIRDEPANLDAGDAAFKRAAFQTYAVHDVDICPNGAVNCPPPGGFYDGLLSRQYRADAGWVGDLVVPLPADDPAESWPVTGSHHTVRNRATGLELAVENASTADAAPIIGWPHTGTPNQRWRFEANPQGWELVASHSDKSLDLPESSPVAGVQAIQFQRLGGVNQTLRVRGNPTAGYRFVFAHSGLALSVSGAAGAPVVQQPVGPSANQIWDVEPA